MQVYHLVPGWPSAAGLSAVQISARDLCITLLVHSGLRVKPGSGSDIRRCVSKARSCYSLSLHRFPHHTV